MVLACMGCAVRQTKPQNWSDKTHYFTVTFGTWKAWTKDTKVETKISTWLISSMKAKTNGFYIPDFEVHHYATSTFTSKQDMACWPRAAGGQSFDLLCRHRCVRKDEKSSQFFSPPRTRPPCWIFYSKHLCLGRDSWKSLSWTHAGILCSLTLRWEANIT